MPPDKRAKPAPAKSPKGGPRALEALRTAAMVELVDRISLVQGAKGDRGEPGPKGDKGERGEKGDVGPEGPPGQPGTNGTDGRDGADGKPGRDGRDGRDGVDGKDGAPGKDGAAGSFGDAWEGEWERGREYAKGRIVGWRGSSWTALEDTDSEPGGVNSAWGLVAAKGRDGVMLAGGGGGGGGEQGPQGEPGPQGEQGPPGEQGETGPQGPPGDDGEDGADFTPPTGTGFAHVTSGAVDAAAKLVENADVHASAAIALSKLANITSDRLLGRDTASAGAIEEIIVSGGIEFNGSGRIQTSAFTGDATKSAGGTALTIANDAVTLAKMADLATDRIIGRDTAGTGDPEALTVGGGVEFTGSGGIQSSAHTGDVTKSAGGTVTTIAAEAVTVAKLSAFQRVFGDRNARRVYEIRARKGATTRLPMGVGVAPAITGAGTSALSSEGVLQTLTTAASVNAIAGGLLTDSEGDVLRSDAPRALFRIKASPSTTDLRIFVGLTDTALGAADDPAAVAAVFRYSTSASDPGWVCVTRSGTLTVSGSVRAYTASEVLLMGIDFEDTGTARFWMGTNETDIAAVHTTTSSLFNIASTVRLMVGVGAVAASARVISFDRAVLVF